MPEESYVAGLTEIRFLEEYERTVLSKPQMVADAALKALAFAPPYERPALVGMLAEQLVEAALRLTRSVRGARRPDGLGRAAPAGTASGGGGVWWRWRSSRAQRSRRVSCGGWRWTRGQWESAAQLRGLPIPDWLPALIEASTASDALAMPAPIDELAVTGTNAEGERLEVRLAAGEKRDGGDGGPDRRPLFGSREGSLGRTCGRDGRWGQRV